MRLHFLIPLLAAAAGASGCDSITSPRFALIPTLVSGFAVTPSKVRLVPGQSAQLSTNAPQQQVQNGNIEWISLSPRIAFVTPTGLVTAGDTGIATIVARVLTDTTREAVATVQVVAPSFGLAHPDRSAAHLWSFTMSSVCGSLIATAIFP